MKKVITHSGGFHADDVFAVATLQLLLAKEQVEVVRTRDDEVIAQGDYVVDVGGVYDAAHHRFDHHQPGAPVRDNGIPYAAFGLVWKHFGLELCGSEEIAAIIDEKLCWPIDLLDNAMAVWERGAYDIAPFSWDGVLQSWRAEPALGEDMNEQFLIAVDFARAYLMRRIQREQIKLAQKNAAESLYAAAADKKILVSDTYVPRSAFIEKDDVQMVVFPREADALPGWVAVGVQIAEDSFLTRVQFPEAWAGLRDEELAAVSGIPDAIFCHKDRYMFIAKSKESAVQAAERTV